jgi:deazaflavin-dependent oxidoreductase (nitroreductase family)
MSNEDLFGDEHVRAYRETDGDRGYHWKRETTILLLTTTGRRSGEPRTMPLIFTYDGENPVIVASKGGMDEHPAWYLNLQAHPEAEVQIRGDVFGVRARDAEGEERERLWRQMAEVWPDYDAYQARTERRIPVVVLERV